MTILITGGSGGLGKALASVLGQNYNIVTIGREGCDYNCEFEDEYDLETELEKITDDGHTIHTVIHAAGRNHIAPHGILNTEMIYNLLAINAVSNFIINDHFKKELLVSCHVVSDAAWTPMTHSLAYNVSKAAQLMLVKQMAHEEKGYTIFSVSPGKIAGTGMSKYIDETFPALRGMTYEQGRQYQLSRLKTGELSPTDTAKFIALLVEQALTSFGGSMHGHNYTIGG